MLKREMITLKPVTDKKEVYRYLGYVENKTILPEKIINMIDECIHLAQEISKPKGVYQTLEIKDKTGDMVTIKGVDWMIRSKDIANLLEGSAYSTFMGVTIGEAFDREVERLFQMGEYTKASIMDAVGSDLAEQAANLMSEHIARQAKENGYHLTMRYSPGYGDFTLENQPGILHLIGAEEIDLHASESCLLMPRKSVTALTGWAAGHESSNHKQQKCQTCRMKDCRFKCFQ